MEVRKQERMQPAIKAGHVWRRYMRHRDTQPHNHHICECTSCAQLEAYMPVHKPHNTAAPQGKGIGPVWGYPCTVHLLRTEASPKMAWVV